ncbi:hypothetical protein WN59_08575 [Salinicoccus sediminis]|uniref:Uncharacterized protein n=1 Tax=Salinicoccus sediminis TaxID=1432562 RepID=A0A0M2SN96_9STAP|nr:hypothetical protein WN59_08575 [Salinicoccus sediminis]
MPHRPENDDKADPPALSSIPNRRQDNAFAYHRLENDDKADGNLHRAKSAQTKITLRTCAEGQIQSQLL